MLDDTKTLKCPYPREQCDEAFQSMQDLKFHLQDVHCVDLKRGCKRSCPDSDATPRPSKTKISGDNHRRHPAPRSDGHIKQEYKFVDEAAKILAEVPRSSTGSATSTRSPTPSLGFSSESDVSGYEELPSLDCGVKIENIDPRLLTDTSLQTIEPSMYDTIETVDLTGLDEELTSSKNREDFIKDEITAHSSSSPKTADRVIPNHSDISARENPEKDCALDLNVLSLQLHEESPNSDSTSYFEGMLVNLMWFRGFAVSRSHSLTIHHTSSPRTVHP